MFLSHLSSWPMRPRWMPDFCNAGYPPRAGGHSPIRDYADQPHSFGSITSDVIVGGAVSPDRHTGILIAEMDVIDAATEECLGEQLKKRLTPVNWQLVRQYIRSKMGVNRFVSVVDFDPSDWVRRERLRRHMMRRGYRHKEPRRSKFGFHRDIPSKDWIGWRLESLIDSWGPKLPAVCLVSHDGIYAEPLARLLALGVRIGLVGLTERLSPELYGLTGPDSLSETGQVRLFDLETDIHAIDLPLRWHDVEHVNRLDGDAADAAREDASARIR